MTIARVETTAAYRVRRRVAAPVTAVWEVLADGWSYSSWVVGTARIRAVEVDWPRPGSRIHHSFGTWPMLVDDHTEIVREEEGRLLEMIARGWPAGEARVHIELRAVDGGCEVSIAEDAVDGPGALVPVVVRQPLIAARNRETLRRLSLRAEHRSSLSGT